MTTVEKVEKEDGTTVYVASDGKEYKSKSGAWKWEKKLEKSKPIETEEQVEVEEKVDWTEMTFEADDITETIPKPLKRIRPRSGKPTKRQLQNEREMNVGILKVGYRTSDALLTRYKRGVLNDDEAAAIKHSEEDYEWISNITQDALDHNNVNIASAVGPNQLAVAANGYWFGSVFVKINAEAGKAMFSGGRMVSVLERVPFIGKRIKDRRMRRIEERLTQEEL